MSVSTRNSLASGATLLLFSITGGLALAGTGGNNGGGHGGSHGHNGQQGGGHHAPQGPSGPNIHIGGPHSNGPNINIGGPQLSVHQTNIYGGGGSIRGGGGGTVIVGGGGGAVFGASPVAPSTVDGLNVVGANETYMETITEQIPQTETVCVDQIVSSYAIRPVRAVCIDDTGIPHPASRPSSDRDVSRQFNGEIFRCMAGTSMQVTLGSISGNTPDFSQADSFTCQKGEALVHIPGGQLTCRVQAPQRNCNERSLLRRHGAGWKLIHTHVQQTQCVPESRTTYQTVERQVQRTRASVAQSIVFDGGVGQTVY